MDIWLPEKLILNGLHTLRSVVLQIVRHICQIIVPTVVWLFCLHRAGEIVQILVYHPAFYEEHDTSEEDCCLTCGLINIRQ
jgi:hypothetical protein